MPVLKCFKYPFGNSAGTLQSFLRDLGQRLTTMIASFILYIKIYLDSMFQLSLVGLTVALDFIS